MTVARRQEEGDAPDFGGALEDHLTDAGNAERFYRDHSDRFAFVAGVGWLYFDDTRWRPAGPDLMRAAKSTAVSIYAEAGSARGMEQRKKIGDWAIASESAAKLQAMLTLAECELTVSADTLDSDPWLLNCQNGTIDLRTGELRDHNANDYITKVTGVDYDPEAHSELWDRVVTHALPDEEVRDYVQRAAGYTLTGVTGEDVFFLIHGLTRTSKGTVQEAIATSLGGYAITSELDMLAQRQRGTTGAPRPELTRLRGARMVSIYETSRRMILSASLVKSLAGSDPITARALYQAPMTFKPTSKIWVATNHRPTVPADDEALWQRIREIPFNEQLSEEQRDRTVRARLLEPEHGAAILRWAVDGCLLWQAGGLGYPDAVRAAGLEYRLSVDLPERYLSKCCTFGKGWTPIARLRGDFEAWCQSIGEDMPEGDLFTKKLHDRGCKPKKNSNAGGRGWTGVTIRADR